MTDTANATRLARDAAHRARALDPATSFLVQAPAGSGKTELLIQRYLALLARVDAPQRVVAMTFTRKAASEMRERVVSALQAARDDVPVESAHAQVTRTLAAAVLARGAERAWSLLEHPAQLAILTIDALSARLAQQAPVTSSMGAAPRVVERADALYTEAARATLADADPADPAWQRLLAHLDNDAGRVVELLAAMLARREQWLPHVLSRDESTLRAHVEAALQADIEAELGAARARFDAELLAALGRSAGQAAEVLRSQGADTALAHALELCRGHDGLPPPTAAHVEAWRHVGGWLLTGKGEARKTMDKRGGVLAGAQKTQALALLESLAARPATVAALNQVQTLPDATYGDEDWAIVAALLHVLPLAAAQLAVVFAQRGAVDFAQLNTAAMRALGATDAPSELLLRMDLAIEHLLVDEFQDTSEAQFSLIELLTSGWQPGDGRTLFAVGDPMQSIYRFRDAEVRLFLDAIAHGRVGHVPVEFIDLARNFRSQGALVGWVNRVFPDILGEHNAPWRGAVAFAAAAAAHPVGEAGEPTLSVVASREEEATRVVELVRAALAAHSPDIAILVRARGELAAILPALRAADIPFAAVELDALESRQAVQDALALAHALVQPADRLAALSVLRAPWCGLALADLFLLAPHARDGLPGILAAWQAQDGLSEDARTRLARTFAVIEPALAAHGKATLADRARGAWLALGGPATLDESVDVAAVDDFFALLREHASGTDIDDWHAMRAELALRFVTSPEEAITPVKIMTLFRAKGLEFDTVIIPGLARNTARDDAQLLHWRSRPQGLLLASPGRAGAKNGVYEYLKELAATEADHELGRMLYVGVTRARRRLDLVAVLDVRADRDTGALHWQRPSSKSSFGRLWPVVERELMPPQALPETRASPAPVAAPPLLRLAEDFALPALPASVLPAQPRIPREERPVFEWARAEAAIVGTVAHRHLARRASGVSLAGEPAALRTRVRAELLAEGVSRDTLEAATDDVLAVLAAVEDDERGRWLFDPAHAEAQSEWALAGIDAGGLVHVTLDRTFVADGVRWIVDFKTGRHEGANRAAFLDAEEARYRPQLARYARIVRGLDARPIRLALYHPRVPGGWREWAVEPPGTQAALF